MGLNGIKWDFMGFYGILWDLMGLNGIKWDIQWEKTIQAYDTVKE